MNRRVEDYYDRQAENEWARAERHPVESATNWRAMKQYIPARSRILDVGAGPGRYSIRLAQAGHRVTLLDLSGASVDLAKKKAAELGVHIQDFVHATSASPSNPTPTAASSTSCPPPSSKWPTTPTPRSR